MLFWIIVLCCRFGETLNVTRLLKDECEPGRIHVSPFTAELLQDTPEYQLVYRGVININDKEAMETFWLLTNEENFQEATESSPQLETKFYMVVEDSDDEENDDEENDDAGVANTEAENQKRDEVLGNSEITDPMEMRLSRMSVRRPDSQTSLSVEGRTSQLEEPTKDIVSLSGNAEADDREYQDFLVNSEITAHDELRYE